MNFKSQGMKYMDEKGIKEIIISFLSQSSFNTLLHSNLQKKTNELQKRNAIAKETVNKWLL
jgi:hypothetical protein